MAFHEVQFPTAISRGSRIGPRINASIMDLDSGQDYRIARWPDAKRSYNARWGIKSQKDAYAVYDFYLSRFGVVHGFRWKDWFDYATTLSGTTFIPGQSTVTNLDVTIGVGDNQQTDFQLIKRYGLGQSWEVVRNIEKPVVGTVLVSKAGVSQTETTHFTVNYGTGVITFGTAPGLGQVIKAGFQFDVPAQFGAEVADGLQFQIDDFNAASLPDIPIIEMAASAASVGGFDYGYGSTQSFSVETVASPSVMGRNIRLNPQIDAARFRMPSASNLPTGGPHFFLKNVHATNACKILDPSKAEMFSLLPGESAIMAIFLSGATKVWEGFI